MFTSKGIVRQLLRVFTHQLMKSEGKLLCEFGWYGAAADGGWRFRFNKLVAMWVLPRIMPVIVK